MSNIFQSNGSATIIQSNTKTMSGNNATVNVPLFGITGTVEVKALYGIVTTILGANHTASLFRLNDQSVQTNMSAAAGIALSAAAVGSFVGKVALAATATNVQTAAAGRLLEPTTAETFTFSGFVIVKKNGAATNIEYQYATTDAPTSGAIQFFIEWVGRSADAAVSNQ